MCVFLLLCVVGCMLAHNSNIIWVMNKRPSFGGALFFSFLFRDSRGMSLAAYQTVVAVVVDVEGDWNSRLFLGFLNLSLSTTFLTMPFRDDYTRNLVTGSNTW